MKPIGVIPCMITLGNAVCGFSAIVKISQGHYLAGAWLILLAMVFDALDGKVARMTKQTSAFGAELDSLSDAISFGIAPALLVALMNGISETKTIWPKAAWFFCLAFALCAILRLARFNVEEKQGRQDHRSFRGLPSPAAAGMVASLVIFSYFVEGLWMEELGPLSISQATAERAARLIVVPLLPAATLVLGYLMISGRVTYPHLVSRYISGKRNFEYFAYLTFIVFLAAAMREIALVVGFGVYVASGPIRLALRDVSEETGEDIAFRALPAEGPKGTGDDL